MFHLNKLSMFATANWFILQSMLSKAYSSRDQISQLLPPCNRVTFRPENSCYGEIPLSA